MAFVDKAGGLFKLIVGEKGPRPLWEVPDGPGLFKKAN